MIGRQEKIRLAIVGLKAAQARYTDARTQPEPDAVFVALSEALWWCGILRDLTEQNDKSVGALRYARNRVGHDHEMTDLLHVTGGASFPIQFPMTFYEWRWMPLGELPPPGHNFWNDPKGEEAYENELEGEPARLTLHRLSAHFDEVVAEE